jgi:hypothetical protein
MSNHRDRREKGRMDSQFCGLLGDTPVVLKNIIAPFFLSASQRGVMRKNLTQRVEGRYSNF